VKIVTGEMACESCNTELFWNNPEFLNNFEGRKKEMAMRFVKRSNLVKQIKNRRHQLEYQ